MAHLSRRHDCHIEGRPLLRRIGSPAHEIDARLTMQAGKIFLKGERLTAHMRAQRTGFYRLTK
jgi:hypothetical protein